MTLTGKRPPNRDPELQRTELVQDTKALRVQDTKALMMQDIKIGTMKGLKTAVGPNVALHAPSSARTVLLHSRPKPLQREQDRCGEEPMRLVTCRIACRPHKTLPVDRALSSQQLRGSLSIRAAHAAEAGGRGGGVGVVRGQQRDWKQQ